MLNTSLQCCAHLSWTWLKTITVQGQTPKL